MSVRAYLVKEIKFADGASFNLWHDEAVMDWLEGNTDFYSRLNGDGNGMTEISVEDVERMLAELGDKIIPAPAKRCRATWRGRKPRAMTGLITSASRNGRRCPAGAATTPAGLFALH